ncbi:MAG: helix-turn-helix domain-containing protein [Eubacteriales bacterium]
MSREDIPKNIARNITELRKKAGMTQARLAEEIGYSDKSISKWERGEGVPDIICLKNMADLFGVSVDYFLEAEHATLPANEQGTSALTESVAVQGERYVINRAAIVGVALAGVVLLSSLIFVILKMCGIVTLMPFVIACPVFTLLLIIFNSIWGKTSYNFAVITLFVWSLLFLISYILRPWGMWSIMLLGFPATLVVWLSCRVKKKVSRE